MSDDPTKPKPPLAKPSGVLLADHVRNLLDQAERACEMRPFVLQKYREMTGEDFRDAVRQSIIWHDEGKKHPHWQEPCRKDYQKYLTLTDAEKKKYRAPNLQKSGIRHEMASLEFIERSRKDVSLPIKVAVAAHHSKLSRFSKHRDRWLDPKYPEFKKFWLEFVGESESLRFGEIEKAILQRYHFDGVRAWLQMTDQRASAFEDGDKLPDLATFRYEFPHESKRGVQLEIEKIWDEPFAILRAPTGAGKTDAALLWAKHQVEQGRADRLVVAMPTRFTANALSIAVTNENFQNVGDSGLYHSSAWYQRIKNHQNPTREERRFIDKEQELARKLETPFTVTTIDHLCICLTGTRENHHAIFFGLAHSCVVIDESDFYDDFTQENIVILLRALRILKVPVLLMSATVPESARETFSKSGFKIEQIYADNSDVERPRCRVTRYKKAETPEDIEELLERALNGEPTIIYANTVARAQAYYKWFKDKIENSDVKLRLKDVVLYHSRFIEPHKVEKEAKLIRKLGRKAWKRGWQHGVAILTQIGEISVNISADLMISDLCPLDRLAQRVGRLSRFGETVGELFVIEPLRTNKNGEQTNYPAPYGTFKPKAGWEESDALKRSNKFLKDGVYSAKDFVDLVNQLYPNAKLIDSRVRENARNLENLIVTNWLILPSEKVEDDDGTKDWQSRDVPPQYTVLAGFDRFDLDSDFRDPTNKAELSEFEIRYGITCYAYEYNLAVENRMIEPAHFSISHEIVERPIVRTEFYDENIGLNFNNVDDNFL